MNTKGRYQGRRSAGAFKQGFTLIEVLTVLAVIAILSAILFSVFSKVRENGRSATCQSNLKQIALAFQQYSADNAGRYPFWYNDVQYNYRDPEDPLPTNPFSNRGWAKVIQPYIKNAQVFQCPADSDERLWAASLGNYTDYAYNLNLSGRQESHFSAPSSTVLNAEHGGLVSTTWLYTGFPVVAEHGEPGSTWHSGGGHYSFVDGHVKWLRPEKVSGCWDASLEDIRPNGKNYTFCTK